jgi:hypothetical protein
MSSFRNRTRVALRAAAVIVVVGALAAVYLLRDPVPRIYARRSHLTAVSVTADSVVGDHRVSFIRLRAESGLEIELAVKRPPTPGRRPLVILLGGHRTGRDAVHLIDDTRGVIVAALSYPFSGNHRVKGLAIIGEVPAIRRGILDTPPALMLALDYLAAQPDVDTTRVEAVGVSLGAPFVTMAAALDRRIDRVWAVHGSAGSYKPIEFNLRRQLGTRAASVPIAALATMLISGPRLAPERWVQRIAPRPFVMINASDDERIPRSSIELLYATAGEPKEIIWRPGAHVRSEAEAVRPLVSMVLDRVLAKPVGGGFEPY